MIVCSWVRAKEPAKSSVAIHVGPGIPGSSGDCNTERFGVVMTKCSIGIRTGLMQGFGARRWSMPKVKRPSCILDRRIMQCEKYPQELRARGGGHDEKSSAPLTWSSGKGTEGPSPFVSATETAGQSVFSGAVRTLSVLAIFARASRRSNSSGRV